LVELDAAQPPAPELREGRCRPEVGPLRECDRVPGGEEGEHERCGRPGAGREQEGVSAVELPEPALGLDAGGMAVALVVELAWLALAVRPDRGAVEHSP